MPSLMAREPSPQISSAMYAHVHAPFDGQLVFGSLPPMRGGRGACGGHACMYGGRHIREVAHACMGGAGTAFWGLGCALGTLSKKGWPSLLYIKGSWIGRIRALF